MGAPHDGFHKIGRWSNGLIGRSETWGKQTHHDVRNFVGLAGGYSGQCGKKKSFFSVPPWIPLWIPILQAKHRPVRSAPSRDLAFHVAFRGRQLLVAAFTSLTSRVSRHRFPSPPSHRVPMRDHAERVEPARVPRVVRGEPAPGFWPGGYGPGP